MRAAGNMKTFSTSSQRKKCGKRTEYIARLTHYDNTRKRKGVSKSAPTHWDAKRELQDLIDQHVAGGAEILEARNMTFAALAEYCKETRYCEALLSDITVNHLQHYGRKRLSTRTNRRTYTDVATVNRELPTCRAMLNDGIVNDWLVRSPFVSNNDHFQGNDIRR